MDFRTRKSDARAGRHRSRSGMNPDTRQTLVSKYRRAVVEVSTVPETESFFFFLLADGATVDVVDELPVLTRELEEDEG